MSPGLDASAGRRAQPAGGDALINRLRSAPASTTRPSIRFTSPMKSATQREIRLLVDFRRRRDLDQPAAVHHADAVGDRHRLLLVVGDDDEGEARASPCRCISSNCVSPRSFLSSAASGSSSSSTRGRLTSARAQRDTLALAAGELVRLARAEAARA